MNEDVWWELGGQGECTLLLGPNDSTISECTFGVINDFVEAALRPLKTADRRCMREMIDVASIKVYSKIGFLASSSFCKNSVEEALTSWKKAT